MSAQTIETIQRGGSLLVVEDDCACPAPGTTMLSEGPRRLTTQDCACPDPGIVSLAGGLRQLEIQDCASPDTAVINAAASVQFPVRIERTDSDCACPEVAPVAIALTSLPISGLEQPKKPRRRTIGVTVQVPGTK